MPKKIELKQTPPLGLARFGTGQPFADIRTRSPMAMTVPSAGNRRRRTTEFRAGAVAP